MRRLVFIASSLGSILLALACTSDDGAPAAAETGTVDSGPGNPGPGPGPGPGDNGPTPGDGGDAGPGSSGGGAIWTQTHTTCAMRPSGKIACWGPNEYGELGDGTQEVRLSFVEVKDVTDAVEVRVGTNHACARKPAGTVVCWGRSTDGALGDGVPDAGRLVSLAPVAVKGLTDAVEIELGTHHSCARRAGGSVVCWGDNAFGKLGDGTNDIRYEPVAVKHLTDAVELSAGFHTCARRASGAVVCWGGSNEDGELGSGTTDTSYEPVAVKGLTDAVSISVNSSNSCARRANGTVVCWGSNSGGQLGIGHTDAAGGALEPGDSVVGLTDAVQVAVGHTGSCSLRATGAVVCWGSNNFGQLGNGSKGTASGTPVTVSGITDAVGIAVGQWHACARRGTGGVVCWGYNGNAQIGDGTKNERLVPTPVSGLP